MAVGTARGHWRCLCQGPAQHWAHAKAEAGLRGAETAQGAPAFSTGTETETVLGSHRPVLKELQGTAGTKEALQPLLL